jgi:hypothetical protein
MSALFVLKSIPFFCKRFFVEVLSELHSGLSGASVQPKGSLMPHSFQKVFRLAEILTRFLNYFGIGYTKV